MPVINFMNNFIYLIIVSIGGLLAIAGKVAITVGDISAITMYARQFIQPIANLAQLFNSLQQGLAGAERVFTLIDEEKVAAFTTPVVFSNLFYILSKFRNCRFAHSSLRKLRLLIKVINVDEKVVDLALNSEFKDFEDAIQFYSAKLQKLDIIITRNVKDFVSKEVVILTAEDYIERLRAIT
jgi:ABC-type multidrug transport system fused ATPase/permease subunit